jgi:truncated hemoglobin YjbI
MGSQIPTIYEWAGGRPAFERWLGRFYDLVENDELIAPLFGGKVRDQHSRDVVTWWCEVMGGPAACTDHLGGYEQAFEASRIAHNQRATLAFRHVAVACCRWRQTASGSGVPGSVDGLRRAGYAPGDAQFQRC